MDITIKQQARHPMQLLMMGIDEDFIDLQTYKAAYFEEIVDMKEDQLKDIFRKKWKDWMESYKRRLEQEFVEGQNLDELNKKRSDTMNQTNPKVVLRNYMAEEVIQAAEKDNFTPVKELLQILMNQFGQDIGDIDKIKACKVYPKTPQWALNICVSCSS